MDQTISDNSQVPSTTWVAQPTFTSSPQDTTPVQQPLQQNCQVQHNAAGQPQPVVTGIATAPVQYQLHPAARHTQQTADLTSPDTRPVFYIRYFDVRDIFVLRASFVHRYKRWDEVFLELLEYPPSDGWWVMNALTLPNRGLIELCRDKKPDAGVLYHSLRWGQIEERLSLTHEPQFANTVCIKYSKNVESL